jgi:hypothetical protein
MARKFGGILFYGSPNVNYPLSQQGTGIGQFQWFRGGLGNIFIEGPGTAAAGTINAWANLADLKRPFITFQYPGIFAVQPTSNEFQEVFGTAAGGPSNPFSGGATAAQFEVPPLPWGIAIVDVFAVYSVVTTALTSATLGCNRATYVENTAFTNTALIAATGVALTVSASASSPHVQKVAASNPLVFESNDISDINIEFTAVTGATANSLQLYGLGAHVVACYD